ncbi:MULTISPECIES: hypothetical protein [unclassified Streptomyces]|uniref:hypothetical protein n=1 Tax=unclassified Streptomyces TaxID=2593676 RepID=UPI00386949D3
MILNGGLSPARFAVDTSAKDARSIVEAGRKNGVRLDIAAAYYASFDEGDVSPR